MEEEAFQSKTIHLKGAKSERRHLPSDQSADFSLGETPEPLWPPHREKRAPDTERCAGHHLLRCRACIDMQDPALTSYCSPVSHQQRTRLVWVKWETVRKSLYKNQRKLNKGEKKGKISLLILDPATSQRTFLKSFQQKIT